MLPRVQSFLRCRRPAPRKPCARSDEIEVATDKKNATPYEANVAIDIEQLLPDAIPSTPYRAAFFENSIVEAIRNKIRIDPSCLKEPGEHWLLKRFIRRDALIETSFSLSSLGYEHDVPVMSECYISMPVSSRGDSHGGYVVSVPLGPTHMLELYSGEPSPAGRYSQLVGMLINDLFMLHCRELKARIPNRDPGLLPQIPLFVPDLNSFPLLVVYMHTKDQASLLSSVLPSWLIDILDLLQHQREMGLVGNGSRVFNSRAQQIGNEKSYHEIIEVAKAVSGLMRNIRDVGFEDITLNERLDLADRFLRTAINANARMRFEVDNLHVHDNFISCV